MRSSFTLCSLWILLATCWINGGYRKLASFRRCVAPLVRGSDSSWLALLLFLWAAALRSMSPRIPVERSVSFCGAGTAVSELRRNSLTASGLREIGFVWLFFARSSSVMSASAVSPFRIAGVSSQKEPHISTGPAATSRGVSTRHTESVRHKTKRPRIWRATNR